MRTSLVSRHLTILQENSSRYCECNSPQLMSIDLGTKIDEIFNMSCSFWKASLALPGILIGGSIIWYLYMVVMEGTLHKGLRWPRDFGHSSFDQHT